jgi:hypothetical protein
MLSRCMDREDHEHINRLTGERTAYRHTQLRTRSGFVRRERGAGYREEMALRRMNGAGWPNGLGALVHAMCVDVDGVLMPFSLLLLILLLCFGIGDALFATRRQPIRTIIGRHGLQIQDHLTHTTTIRCKQANRCAHGQLLMHTSRRMSLDLLLCCE